MSDGASDGGLGVHGRAMTYAQWMGALPGNDVKASVTLIAEPPMPMLPVSLDAAMVEAVILTTAMRRAANRLDEAMDEIRARRRNRPPGTSPEELVWRPMVSHYREHGCNDWACALRAINTKT